MIQSIFVYSFTFLTLYYIAIVAQKGYVARINHIKIENWEILIAIIFALIFGIRYNVGIDYISYKENYDSVDFERLEFLFKNLSLFLAKSGFHFSVYFFLWAFLQIYFVLMSLKDEKNIYPSLIFTLFTGQYFLLWMNVIRQDIAACIFIFSITYIAKKNFLAYVFCILLAIGFHKTAIILLVIYPILRFRKSYFNNIILQLLLLLICIYWGVISDVLAFWINLLFQPFVSSMGYEEQYGIMGISKSIDEVKLGMSFGASFLIDIIIIIYSKKMKIYYKNDRFIYFYDLYFIGSSTYYLFAKSYIFQRPFRYFRFFKMIISAYLLHYLYKHSKNRINIVVFFLFIALHIILYIALFRYNKEACYTYLFFWQS